MTKRTKPRQAMSKSAVNATQRALLADALRLSIAARELSEMADRLMRVCQSMQTAQRR